MPDWILNIFPQRIQPEPDLSISGVPEADRRASLKANKRQVGEASGSSVLSRLLLFRSLQPPRGNLMLNRRE